MRGGDQKSAHLVGDLLRCHLPSVSIFPFSSKPLLLGSVMQDAHRAEKMSLPAPERRRAHAQLYLVPIKCTQAHLACDNFSPLLLKHAHEWPVLECQEAPTLVVCFVEPQAVSCRQVSILSWSGVQSEDTVGCRIVLHQLPLGIVDEESVGDALKDAVQFLGLLRTFAVQSPLRGLVPEDGHRTGKASLPVPY